MDYHSDFSHVSKTMLNLFCRSREEYFHTYVAGGMPPKLPSKVMLAGTVLHSMLLENKKFYELCAEYPSSCLKSNGDLNGKAAADFRDEWPDLICMKSDECEAVRAICEAVLAKQSLASLLKASPFIEQRFDAEIEGVKCKCKPDIACELDDKIIVCDLKFTEDIHPDRWRRNSKALHYWLQDAHYSSCLEATLDKPVTFRFCVIETKFPFRIKWRHYVEESRITAREEHRKLLRQLKQCHETGNWEDEWSSETVLEPWDIANSDELVEVEQ